MGKGTPFMDAAVRAYAEDVIERAQRNIGATRTIRGKRRRRVSSGNLQRSLTYFMSQNQFKYVLDFTAEPSALAYADVIEKGRRPKRPMPPPSEILAWMNQKNIRLQKKGGGFIKETPALRKSVAFLIARSIGEKGIEGIHYYRDAIEDSRGDAGSPSVGGGGGGGGMGPLIEAMNKEIQTRLILR